jgi:Trk K+ transport system NAD-binding subunit
LPGYETRRINVPKAWVGQTLSTLNLDEQFDVNVIGLLDQSEGDEELAKLSSSMLTKTLEQGDVLVIYGSNENLDALEAAIAEM